MKTYNICMLLFPELTILDFAGPYEVFSRAACFNIQIVSENTNPLQTEGGTFLKADYTFDDSPPADILFVPGGKGITPVLTNEKYLNFLKKQAETAQYITGVCTGSLILAAAGLLQGYKATTHWRSIELLRKLNVEAVDERVVIDRNRITGGGITAGVDFGLVLTALLAGEDMAKTIQLLLEYAPQPPFNAGSPKTAEPHIVQKALNLTRQSFDVRLKLLDGIVEQH